MSTKKAPPPSRIRYEQSHPTISIRLDQESAAELTTLLAASGLTLPQLLKRVIAEQAPPLAAAHLEGVRRFLHEMKGEAWFPDCEEDIENILSSDFYDELFGLERQELTQSLTED